MRLSARLSTIRVLPQRLQHTSVQLTPEEIIRSDFVENINVKKIKKLQPACYGGRHLITMIPGHGMGSEMMGIVREITEFMNIPIDYEVVEVGTNPYEVKYAISSILRNIYCIKGNMQRFTADIEEKRFGYPNVSLRQILDLYVCVNEFKSFNAIRSRYKDLDIVVIRQNTESEYSTLEHQTGKGIVESMKVITDYNTERCAKWALNYARRRHRKKITVIHKANIMKLSDGLFLNRALETGMDYPDIKMDSMIVDNTCMQLTSNPRQFDVMLCPNLYGAIVCNVLAGLCGTSEVFTGCNIGDTYAAFESASRRSHKEVIGQNIANPFWCMRSLVDLLMHMKLKNYAIQLNNSIHKTIEEDLVHTEDMGGKATTRDVVEQVKKNLLIYF